MKYECEWCGDTGNPTNSKFRYCIIFGDDAHYICEDCYKHLIPVEGE